MKHIVMLSVVVLLLTAAPLFAATVSIEDRGSGVYYIMGHGFSDEGGVEVEVRYDTATLSNPRISQGSLISSAMFIPNPKFSASSIKIAAMSLTAIKGDGDLAVITFDLKGATAGPVLVTRYKTAKAVKQDTGSDGGDSGGGVTGGSSDTGNNNGGNNDTSGGGGPSGGGDGGGYTGGSSIGTITLPPDQMAEPEQKSGYQPLVTDLRKDMTVPLGGSEAGATAAAAAAEKKAAIEPKFESYDGVLQLFRQYRGERLPKPLISLFADAEIPGLSQTPAIAIADGKTPLKVRFKLKPVGDDAPKFILQGASVKQLGSEGEDPLWTVDLLPKKGAYDVKLTVLDGPRTFEYPLTVVPPIDPSLVKGKPLSEADFTLYLAKPSKHDLNGDGKFDAADDFIYTANYILAMKIKPEKSPKPAKDVKPAKETKPAAETKPAKDAVPAKGAKPDNDAAAAKSADKGAKPVKGAKGSKSTKKGKAAKKGTSADNKDSGEEKGAPSGEAKPKKQEPLPVKAP